MNAQRSFQVGYSHVAVKNNFKKSPLFMVNGLNPGALSSLCGLIVRVREVPRRTVGGDIDRLFDNLSGSQFTAFMSPVTGK